MPGESREGRLKAAEIAKIHETLWECFVEAGWGSITATQKALGLNKNPLNALIATLDLVDALGRSGRFTEALAEARYVTDYAGILRGNRLAEAALTKLYESACEGALRISLVVGLRGEVARLLDRCRSDSLGDRVRRYRRLCGLTKRQAAAESGVPFDSLRKIEAGNLPGAVHEPKLRSWLASGRPESIFSEGLPVAPERHRRDGS